MSEEAITRAELREELLRWEEGLDRRLESLRAEVQHMSRKLSAIQRHLEVFEEAPVSPG